MWSSRLPPRSDSANQPVYIRSQVDPRRNRLIRDKLRRASLGLGKEIDRETRRICIENRLNSNKKGVNEKILGMWAAKLHVHAEECYDKIFCHHWRLLSHEKNASFVRVCAAILGRHVEQLGDAEAHKARTAHRRQGGLAQSLEKSYKSSARSIREQLEEVWGIEARELELAACIARSQPKAAPSDDVSRAHAVSGNERLGEQMGQWDLELRRIAKAGQAKRQYHQENARIAFPDFTIWQAIDESNLSMLRRGELFGQACQRVASRDGRFELIGDLTGMSPYTAYDIYKQRPSRKKRPRKK
jgi:hypothetical protein